MNKERCEYHDKCPLVKLLKECTKDTRNEKCGFDTRDQPPQSAEEKSKEFAWNILMLIGYNYAQSDVEGACKFLDHPELKEGDKGNYHKWADPYTRRCYCGAIGYTDAGRFYACSMDPVHLEVLRKCGFPDIRNRFGEPYLGEDKK